MNTLLSQAIWKKTNEMFTGKEEAITKEILKNCKDTDSYEKIFSQMIYDSMLLSISMSIETVIDILMEAGVLSSRDEKTIRKEMMSVVQSEKKEPATVRKRKGKDEYTGNDV